MIFDLVIGVLILTIIVLLVLSIIVGRIKSKDNEKILWNLDRMDNSEALTDEDLIMDEMEENERQ